MPKLIERGHVYIAQPPLYKVKKGKQEHYVKDDAELNAYLVSQALQGAVLYVTADAPPLQGPGLESLVSRYLEVHAIIERIARRYDPRVLKQFLYLPRLAADGDGIPQAWLDALAARLSAAGDGPRYDLSVERPDDDPSAWRLKLVRQYHGVASEVVFPRKFFASAEYRRITELADDLTDFIGDGAYVKRGDKEQPVDSFAEAVDWLMAEARRGQSIQRYKGLGEMNADQLWDTTINPDTRRLMQVRIEDAVAADEIFTTLMGDQVEPRREFIEQNALTVTNIDV